MIIAKKEICLDFFLTGLILCLFLSLSKWQKWRGKWRKKDEKGGNRTKQEWNDFYHWNFGTEFLRPLALRKWKKERVSIRACSTKISSILLVFLIFRLALLQRKWENCLYYHWSSSIQPCYLSTAEPVMQREGTMTLYYYLL